MDKIKLPKIDKQTQKANKKLKHAKNINMRSNERTQMEIKNRTK